MGLMFNFPTTQYFKHFDWNYILLHTYSLFIQSFSYTYLNYYFVIFKHWIDFIGGQSCKYLAILVRWMYTRS